MTDDDLNLASAYLDGDVTADERARVEADAELIAEVERLRQVRIVLGDPEPPAISMRERHLAAALDAWDRLPDVERIGAVRDQTPAGVDAAAAAAASTVSAPPPTSLATRRQALGRRRLLAAAAGLVVVLAGGVVLNQVFTDDDDSDTADSAAEPLPEVAADEPASEVEDLARDAGAEFAEGSGSADVGTTDAPAEAAPELADDAPADAPAEAAPDAEGEPVAEGEPTGGPEAAPPEEDVVLLESNQDLLDYGANARSLGVPTADQTADDVAEPTDGGEDAGEDGDEGGDGTVEEGFEVPQCSGIEIVVGPANFRGEQVVVGIDLDTDEAVAHTLDCTEIARVRY